MLHDVLLGRDVISNSGLSFIFTKDEVVIKSNSELDKFKEDALVKSDFLTNEVLLIEQPLDKNEVCLNVNPSLPCDDHLQGRQVFLEHYQYAKRPDQPKIDFEMHLTVPKVEPFYCTPKRLSYAQKSALDRILADLLDKGIIRESNSPYCSRVVLVTKKTGDVRMCVDYRTLNKHLVRDKFPLPVIDDLLDNLHGKRFFTKLDLKNAVYHVSLDENSRKYTSFITPSGQFEFCKMPFGLSSSPSTFTRYINILFRDLIKDKKLIIYLDDLMIATTTIKTIWSY